MWTFDKIRLGPVFQHHKPITFRPKLNLQYLLLGNVIETLVSCFMHAYINNNITKVV